MPKRPTPTHRVPARRNAGSAAPRPRPNVRLLKCGEQRAAKFIRAAIEVFLEKGYRGARLSDIVARAGGSLETLYRVFGDKAGLVHAIMETSISAFDEGLEILYGSKLTPAQALPEAADRMIEQILSPRFIVIHRIVFADGLAFPELRDWYLEHAVAPTDLLLTRYFRREKDAGRLMLDSPAIAAEHFYMMVFGRALLMSVNGIVTPADLPQARIEVREAVSIFLRGVLPR